MASLKQKLKRYRSYGIIEDPSFTGDESATAALARKAYRALHLAFVAVPLVAGVDKFRNVLADWSAYLAPEIPVWLGVPAWQVMAGVGALEIFLSMGILFRPRAFADILAAWIVMIQANLLLHGEHFDIALFNFALLAGASALGRLSRARRLNEEGLDLLEPPEDSSRAA